MDTPTLLQSVRDYVTHVAGTLNETDLKNLGTTLHNVAYSLEDGDDTTLRIGYGVRICKEELFCRRGQMMTFADLDRSISKRQSFALGLKLSCSRG